MHTNWNAERESEIVFEIRFIMKLKCHQCHEIGIHLLEILFCLFCAKWVSESVPLYAYCIACDDKFMFRRRIITYVWRAFICLTAIWFAIIYHLDLEGWRIRAKKRHKKWYYKWKMLSSRKEWKFNQMNSNEWCVYIKKKKPRRRTQREKEKTQRDRLSYIITVNHLTEKCANISNNHVNMMAFIRRERKKSDTKIYNILNRLQSTFGLWKVCYIWHSKDLYFFYTFRNVCSFLLPLE